MTTLFQSTIEHLLKSHNLLEEFHKQETFHVRFDKHGYQRLVIERHGEQISVAHYFEQNGDLVADRDVELHYPSWVPTTITQAFFGYPFLIVIDRVSHKVHRAGWQNLYGYPLPQTGF